MSTSYKKFGIQIKNYRKSKNLTTLEFANLINISTGQLSNIENGNYDVFKLELLGKITKVLNISLQDLLTDISIDINNLYIDKQIINQISENEEQHIDFINNQTNMLVISFLSSISDYKYNTEKIQSITNHLINELHFIKQINTEKSHVSTK
ncbi:helix-turn-helix transcriptional regulator [Lutibacter sp. B2]|nr:helix-turn-helix transcriptional regulator [Lutibacter sp. B2]